MDEVEFEGGAFLGPGLLFEACDLVREGFAAEFEVDLCVECARGIEGNGEYGADEVLPDLGEVEAVDGNGEVVGNGPDGFVEFVV